MFACRRSWRMCGIAMSSRAAGPVVAGGGDGMGWDGMMLGGQRPVRSDRPINLAPGRHLSIHPSTAIPSSLPPARRSRRYRHRHRHRHRRCRHRHRCCSGGSARTGRSARAPPDAAHVVARRPVHQPVLRTGRTFISSIPPSSHTPEAADNHAAARPPVSFSSPFRPERCARPAPRPLLRRPWGERRHPSLTTIHLLPTGHSTSPPSDRQRRQPGPVPHQQQHHYHRRRRLFPRRRPLTPRRDRRRSRPVWPPTREPELGRALERDRIFLLLRRRSTSSTPLVPPPPERLPSPALPDTRTTQWGPA